MLKNKYVLSVWKTVLRRPFYRSPCIQGATQKVRQAQRERGVNYNMTHFDTVCRVRSRNSKLRNAEKSKLA